MHVGPLIISTCVPGLFVRSQLFAIPGEERKFKRRRMVAFNPTCRRERESASSHALVLDGASAVGVVVDSIGAGIVDVMSGVNVGDAVTAGDIAGVMTAIAVDVTSGVDVGDIVAATAGDAVECDVCVAVGEKTRTTVGVICGGVIVAVTVRGVCEGVFDKGRRATVGAGDPEFPLQRRNRKRNNSTIVTISLKRS